MHQHDVRLNAVRESKNRLDTSLCAQELSREIDQAARFSRGGIDEFAAAARQVSSSEVSAKSRVLVSIMLAVAHGCEGCIAKDLVTAIQLHVTRAEIKAALKRGVLMADGPAMVLAAEALTYFDEISAQPVVSPERRRVDALAQPPRQAVPH